MEELGVVCWDEDGTYHLAVAGEIDALSHTRFHEALIDVVDKADAALVLDLTKVAFMGSEGVSALASALRSADKKGVSLRVAAVSRPVQMVLSISGLDDLLRPGG